GSLAARTHPDRACGTVVAIRCRHGVVVAREQGLVFGEVAEMYQQARPTYPAGLYDAIAELAGTSPGDRVLEVGAGTGKATEGFVDRGYAVTAVEPSAEMAGVLAARLPTVDVRVAGLEDVDVETGAYA